MREFFREWKRKVGVLSLVVTLSLMGGWIRSFSVEDIFRLAIGNTDHYVQSEQGSVQWSAVVYLDESPIYESLVERFDWWSSSIRPAQELSLIMGSGQQIQGQLKILYHPIRYWWIVVPLTLLSAVLLLSKPQLTQNPRG